jgi:hypothetical protein
MLAAAAFAASLFLGAAAAWAEGGCFGPYSTQTVAAPTADQSVADSSTATTVKEK